MSYHYDRGERESIRRRPIPDHRGSRPFKGNRSLIILTIDVLVVLILGGIYFTFLRGDPRAAELSGYQFSLRARQFDQGVLISLTVEAQTVSATPGEPFQLRLLDPDPASLATLMVEQELSSDAERLLAGEWVYDLLPEGEGEERSVRLFLPVRGGSEQWSVEVGWGEERARITAPLTE